MSQEYGSELLSVLVVLLPEDQLLAQELLRAGLSISSILHGHFASDTPVILYFPPGRYVLDHAAASQYTCPPHVQLFFAVNALLRVEPGVTLTIEGSIRAGSHQIFGFNRAQTNPPGRPANVISWSLAPD